MITFKLEDVISHPFRVSDADVTDLPLIAEFVTEGMTEADVVLACRKSWTIRLQEILKGSLKGRKSGDTIRVKVVGLFSKRAKTDVEKAEVVMAKLSDEDLAKLIAREKARLDAKAAAA